MTENPNKNKTNKRGKNDINKIEMYVYYGKKTSAKHFRTDIAALDIRSWLLVAFHVPLTG